MIEHDMDRKLLQRTVELARRHGGVDHKQLPKDVRLAIDSVHSKTSGALKMPSI